MEIVSGGLRNLSLSERICPEQSVLNLFLAHCAWRITTAPSDLGRDLGQDHELELECGCFASNWDLEFGT